MERTHGRVWDASAPPGTGHCGPCTRPNQPTATRSAVALKGAAAARNWGIAAALWIWDRLETAPPLRLR